MGFRVWGLLGFWLVLVKHAQMTPASGLQLLMLCSPELYIAALHPQALTEQKSSITLGVDIAASSYVWSCMLGTD